MNASAFDPSDFMPDMMFDDEFVTHFDIDDDGKGPGPSDGKGHGIIGMKERANTFGGSVYTGPIEGGGFRVDDVALPESDQLGGRGICLIRHYMEHVTFDTAAHCLEMSFRRKAC